MLDRHNAYLSKRLQSYKAEELQRIATEPSWLERLLGLVWLPLRPVVHLLGRGMQVTGSELVRRSSGARTNSARTSDTSTARFITRLDGQTR